MLCLRSGHEGLFGTVPEMDIGAVDGFQLVGIDVLVAVADGLSSAGRPCFLAFFQQHVDIVRMEHQFPEPGPVVTCPDISDLVIPERIDAPFGQRQKRSRIHDGMVDDDFVALKHA